jgi:hypothetical protein
MSIDGATKGAAVSPPQIQEWIVWVIRLAVVAAIVFIAGEHFRVLTESPSFWMGELYTAVEAKMSVPGILKYMVTEDVHPPTYIVLSHYWIKLFNDTESSMRSISFVFYFLSLIIALLFSKYMKSLTFWLFVLLILISYGPLYNAHEFRFYTMIFMFAILFLYGDIANSRIIRLLAIVGIAQTHMFGIFVGGLALLTILYRDWEEARAVRPDAILTGFAVMFWPAVFGLSGTLFHASATIAWTSAPWSQPFYDFFHGSFLPLTSLSNAVAGHFPVGKSLVAAALFAGFAAASLRMALGLDDRERRVALNSLFILTALLCGNVLLELVQPITRPRYLIGGIPFACFLAAQLLSNWMARGRTFALLVTPVIIGFAALSAVQAHRGLSAGKLAPMQDWRAVAGNAARAAETPQQLRFYLSRRKEAFDLAMSAYEEANQFYLPPGVRATALSHPELATAPAGTVLMMQHVRPARFEDGRCQNEVTDQLAALGRPYSATFPQQQLQCMNGVIRILGE